MSLWVLVLISFFLSVLLCTAVYINISSNTIYATFSSIFLFIAASSLLILFNFEFLGLAYLTVYVGALAVFFIFILLLFNLRIDHPLEKVTITKTGELYSLLFFITTFLDLFIWRTFSQVQTKAVLERLGTEFKTPGIQYSVSNPISLRREIIYQRLFDILTARKNGIKYVEETSNSVYYSVSSTDSTFYLFEHLQYHLDNHIVQLGYTMYNQYYILIILLGLILLLAMIGGIFLILTTPVKRDLMKTFKKTK